MAHEKRGDIVPGRTPPARPPGGTKRAGDDPGADLADRLVAGFAAAIAAEDVIPFRPVPPGGGPR